MRYCIVGLIAGLATGGALTGEATAQQTAPPDGFFNFELQTNSPAFTSPAVLRNTAADASTVAAQLTAAQAAGRPLAVRVPEPLTNPAAKNIFNQFSLDYVFADYSDTSAVGFTRALADQVLRSSRSSAAVVGNFNFYPNAGSDPTRPAVTNTVNLRFQERPQNFAYPDSRARSATAVGNQMANEALFPGSPDYRNPAQGNSNAPNIRAALFTLPIQRMTLAEAGLRGLASLPTGAAAYSQPGRPSATTNLNVPWVTRFNNFGNPALDSDGNPNASLTGLSTYEFVQNAANPANGQLPSRGDFQAQMLHTRMRGAATALLFDAGNGSVVGYSKSQEQQDLATGWALSSQANDIFGRGNYALANLTNVIGDMNANSGDASPRSTEVSGAVWSGVFDRPGTFNATGERELNILISNLSNAQKIIDLPNNIGGFSTFAPAGVAVGALNDDFTIDAGEHRVLNFELETSSRGRLEWVLHANAFVATDDERNGVGIGGAGYDPGAMNPEPGTAALLVIGLGGLLARRRPRA